MNSNQFTTFGKIFDSDIGRKVVMEILNGLLFGAPETALLSKIRKSYQVEISDLEKLYDAMSVELNNVGQSISDKNDLYYHFRSLLSGANPVGLAYQDLQSRMRALQSEITKERETESTLNKRLDDTSRRISDTSSKSQRTFSEWVVDHPAELIDDNLKEISK